MPRRSSEWMDAHLDEKFPVLDDGFIRIVDYMGTEDSIVQAARVSYGAGTKSVSDDVGLLRYLMRHRHTTPFEMCELKLHVRVPMDCWRQWIRHRMASVNEVSTRYSEAIDSAQKTAPDKWRTQATINKQGSSGYLTEGGDRLTRKEAEFQETARNLYEARLAAGVAREQARKDLPLSTYTEAYWKIDLHNLLHFLGLRMDAHAQEEIRSYANIIGNTIVANWLPNVWEAFHSYRLDALPLSARDVAVLKELLSQVRNASSDKAARGFGWLQTGEDGKVKSNRERQEFEDKMRKLGLTIKW